MVEPTLLYPLLIGLPLLVVGFVLVRRYRHWHHAGATIRFGYTDARSPEYSDDPTPADHEDEGGLRVWVRKRLYPFTDRR